MKLESRKLACSLKVNIFMNIRSDVQNFFVFD